ALSPALDPWRGYLTESREGRGRFEVQLKISGRGPRHVLHEFPNGLLVFALEELREFIEREPAPGRAQDCEPGHAVSEMGQRARKREQVLHDLFFAQLFDLHCAEADPGILERRDDGIEMAAVAHQDRSPAFRRPHLLGNTPRLT